MNSCQRIKCEGICGLIEANIAARKRDIEIIYWITLCIPIAIRFLWSTNDNLKRFLDLYDNDDFEIPAGERENGDLCPLIPELLSQRKEMYRL